MSNHYEDWTDWAGDHPEQAEADLREAARRAERLAEHRRLAAQPIVDRDGADSAAMYARERRERERNLSCAVVTGYTRDSCEHAEVDTQGVCESCGTEVEGWEPSDAQLLTQFGTKDPRRAAA